MRGFSFPGFYCHYAGFNYYFFMIITKINDYFLYFHKLFILNLFLSSSVVYIDFNDAEQKLKYKQTKKYFTI